MKAVHYYAAASWYAAAGLQSLIIPFLPLYYSRNLGFTPSQIGLLAALRPWISAPAGSIAAALADRLGSHRLVLLFCFLAGTVLQSSIALNLFSSFSSQLVLTLGISIVWTGASIIGDAAVMAASTHPGDYGRVRTWASVMWIIISPVAGFTNENYGIKYSIGIYAIGSLLAVPAGWLLPVESLLPKEPTLILAPREEFEEPLLAVEEVEQAPASPLLRREVEGDIEQQRPALAKALAIVRFIETITELGAIPLPGSAYGFAEVATPYAASHFQDSEFAWDKREEGDQDDEEKGEGVDGREEREIEGELPVVTPPSITEPLEVLPKGGQLRVHVPPPPRPEALPSSGPVALPRGMLSHALSAGDLLRDVRDIQPQEQGSSENGGGGGGTEHEEEVHAWMPASPDMEQPREKSELKPAESPGSRSSALKRLAQIFTWRSASTDIDTDGTAAPAGEEEEEFTSQPPTPGSYLSAAGSPSSGTTYNLLSGFTPVQNYLESRRRRLTPPAGTPDVSNGARGGGPSSSTGGPSSRLNLPAVPSLDQILDDDYQDINPAPSISMEAGCEAPPPPQSSTAAALLDAGISPELMREALDMEAAELAGMDPTGSLVVDVLSKKLARMAGKEKRKQARQQRRWRQHQKERHQKHVKFAEPTPHHYPVVYGATPKVSDDSSPLLPPSGITPAESASHSIWSRLVILFHDPSILAFFTIATLLGFGHGIIMTFLFMYLKNLGAKEGLMGWVLLANALPELPVFFFFGDILRAVGMDTLLLGSTAVLSLRIAAYSLFNTPTNNNIDCAADVNCAGASSDVFKTDSLNTFGFQMPLSIHWIYLIETLHAITYAAGWSACALNASKIAPAGLESTTQAVFQGLWLGIGAGSGGLFGGILYHWKGPDALFLCSAGVIGVGCGASGVVLALRHKKRRYQRQHGSSYNLLDL